MSTWPTRETTKADQIYSCAKHLVNCADRRWQIIPGNPRRFPLSSSHPSLVVNWWPSNAGTMKLHQLHHSLMAKPKPQASHHTEGTERICSTFGKRERGRKGEREGGRERGREVFGVFVHNSCSLSIIIKSYDCRLVRGLKRRDLDSIDGSIGIHGNELSWQSHLCVKCELLVNIRLHNPS